jgi:serine/threonine protein kinase
MQGVASRDVKLENVLLEDATAALPLVKLCDFGLSTDCRQPSLRVVGTPGYLSPEMLLAGIEGHPYDAKVSMRS